MKKKIFRRFAVFFLALALLTPVVSVSAPATEVQAAATYTVNLTKVTDAVANKVFKKLMAGQKVVITFNKGKLNKNLFMKLRDRIKSKYAYGMTFDYSYSGAKVVISAKQAKTFISRVKKAKAAAEKKQALIDAATATAVTSANDALAQEIHNTLMAQTPYTFYTKGNPTNICDDLIKMIQEINKQDVIFKYDAAKVSSTDCYEVTINEEYAQAYYWAVSFCEREFAEVQSSMQYMLNEKVIEANDPDYDFAYYYDCLPKADHIIYEAKNFGDLSDIMKLYFVSCICTFDSFTTNGISYTSDRMSTYNQAEVLKALYNSTAHGMCTEFARCEVILFSYWGIDVDYCSNDTHAWTEGVAANSKGEMIRYKFDYELMTWSTPKRKYVDGFAAEINEDNL